MCVRARTHTRIGTCRIGEIQVNYGLCQGQFFGFAIAPWDHASWVSVNIGGGVQETSWYIFLHPPVNL